MVPERAGDVNAREVTRAGAGMLRRIGRLLRRGSGVTWPKIIMAKLTADQQKDVAAWAAEGATLNDIQDKLKREHSVTLTYMETRLLIMELGLKLIDKPKEKLPEPPAPPSPEEAAAQDEGAYDDGDLPPTDGATGGNVTVTLDHIALPGAMVSGKATFSDGKTAAWHLDQMGRLGLRPPEPGYQPPPADIPVFQRELQRLLQTQGY